MYNTQYVCFAQHDLRMGSFHVFLWGFAEANKAKSKILLAIIYHLFPRTQDVRIVCGAGRRTPKIRSTGAPAIEHILIVTHFTVRTW